VKDCFVGPGPPLPVRLPGPGQRRSCSRAPASLVRVDPRGPVSYQAPGVSPGAAGTGSHLVSYSPPDSAVLIPDCAAASAAEGDMDPESAAFTLV